MIQTNTELLSPCPQVLICLATYNGMSFLKMQLNTILNQLDVTIQVNVSDDASNDGTYQHLQNMANIDNRIKLLPLNHKLNSAGKNFYRLILDSNISDFDYVAFADQDDIWLEDKLSYAIIKIQENSVDAYSSNVLAFWPDGSQKLINKAQPQREFDYMFESAGPGCTFVLSKSLALEIQKFLIINQAACQQVALHDWFIYAYARSKGYKWFIDPSPHMLYRQHTENVVGANVGFKAKLARWKKLRNGWLVQQTLLIANLLGYSNALPIKKLIRSNFVDRLWLILNVTKLRRRLRDRVALVLFLLLPLKR